MVAAPVEPRMRKERSSSVRRRDQRAMEAVAHAGVGVRAEADDLTAVVREYRVRAYHFALQMLGNSEDALDVTQEAFLRLHRHWHRRDPARPLAPWLYSILRNLAIDLLRRRASLKEDPLEAAPERASGAGPEILAERSEIKARVWEAIRRLPAAQKEVVILRDLHGLTYAEIAEALNVPVSTVNSRLHDARDALRRKLERHV
jgi:RNA polymerase sigma-70 factor (ECF subfamily)